MGWVKMSATMFDQGQKNFKKHWLTYGWPRTKNFKKHWLKRPKAIPPKMKLGPKYKWFKISYL